MKLTDLPLHVKITITGIGLPLILIFALFVAYAHQSKQNEIARMVDKAKAVCLTVESVRETMDQKWVLGWLLEPIMHTLHQQPTLVRLRTL